MEHTWAKVHLSRVDLENLCSCGLVWIRQLDFSVDATRAEQCRVENVDTVCRRDDLDVVGGGETVELVQQLEHRALHFSVAAVLGAVAFSANSIDFVDEDDRRSFVLRKLERIADDFSALADVRLDERRRRKLQKRCLCLRSARTCKKRLPRSGRSVQQDAFWRFNPNLLELLWMSHGKNNSFNHFLLVRFKY